MIVLFPGTVVVYIPYRLLDTNPDPDLTSLSLAQYMAVLLAAVGIAILFKSIWSFAYVGRGTLAPFDETKKLIVVGLYRYVRNPMYVGVFLILLGEALFYRSPVPDANDESRVFVPAGLIGDGGDNLKMAHHIWVDSKATWDEICDGGHQHPEEFEG